MIATRSIKIENVTVEQNTVAATMFGANTLQSVNTSDSGVPFAQYETAITVAGVTSLNGTDGTDGVDGANGIHGMDGLNGIDGKSAYDLAVDEGYSRTLSEWLQSLKGTDGADGTNGSSDWNYITNKPRIQATHKTYSKTSSPLQAKTSMLQVTCA